MAVQLLNTDCMEYMRGQPDKSFDLAIVDPPYFDGPQKLGFYGSICSKTGIQRGAYHSTPDMWNVPESEYFSELDRVAKNWICWGANHFAGRFNSSSSCWLVWDKDNQGSTFADAELAYTTFPGSVRTFKYRWNGMLQGYHGDKRKNETRIHPTQKPTALYRWTLEKFSRPGDRVLDTHLGSGSSAIAAHFFGVDFVGCEIDRHYYELALDRFNEETKQGSFDFANQASPLRGR